VIRLVSAALVLGLLAPLPAPALGGDGTVSAADVARAREERARTARHLEETTARYEAAVAEQVVLEDRVRTLATEIAASERTLAELRARSRDVVRDMYMVASPVGLAAFFGGGTLTDVAVHSTYLSLAGVQDVAVLGRLTAVENRTREQHARMDEELARRRRLTADMAELAGTILAELERADARYQEIVARWRHQEEERRRREEEERRRQEEEERRRQEEERRRREAATSTTTTTTVPPASTTTTVPPASTTTTVPPASTTTVPPASTTTVPPASTTTVPPSTTTTVPPPTPLVVDGRTCPVDGAVTFSDTWGAPRSGGRTHKGVDMMAARGTPLVAIESGTITRLSNSSLGGISIYLTGESGARYYYAHLDAWADGLAAGQEVTVGDRVGIVGTTGNAPDWLPHLHFQYAPPGGDWVDPYPLVDALCR